ncbi:MAG: tetratricopeptide repeat protein [Clostridium sp.]|nr:tetratricopeptide repeat protein [Clostridium sp.]
MRRYRQLCRALAAVSSVLLLTGCGDSKEAREARMSGIEQLNQKNYEEAIASFDRALSEADGIVGAFELDVLKYRAEAEYLTEDYQAAAHTYDILADVDEGKREYLYYGAASHALAGNLPEAVEAYEKAQGEIAGKTSEQKKTADETKTSENKDEKTEDGKQETESGPASVDPGQKSIHEAVLSPEEEAGRSLALSAIGKAYEDQGQYEEAMSFYEGASSSGLTADLCNRMGLCMMAAEKYDEAISYFEKGMTLQDEVKMPDLKYNEAAAYEYKGNFEKALELLNTYVSDYGSTPEIEREILFLESR